LLVVTIAKANEQARMRRWCLVHSPVSSSGIHNGAAKI
jgi:hypothetical protein